MSAISRLQITLEHDIDEQYQYQPGEIIRGHVCLLLNNDSNIRNITISIFGEGNVSWEDERTTEMHQAKETYIDANSVVIDSPDGQTLFLPRGHENLPFEYELPENMPSSFIGKYGSVTYILKATVQGVRSTDTAITSEPFLILQKKPLPESINSPILVEGSKRIWGGCSLGKVSIRAGADKHGGIPGEDLFINAEVKNRSQKIVSVIQASIIMNSSYFAGKHSIIFSQIVNRKRDEQNMHENEGRRWVNSRLTVPPYIPETRLEHCDIIDIFYTLQFKVEIEGGSEICLESPLIIGAHPAGLEVPNKRHLRNSINSQWTVRSKGLGMVAPAMVSLQEEDEMNEWHGGMIPEHRSDTEITNPLFRQGSFLNNNGRYPEEFKQTQERHNYADRVEIMESTRL